MGALPFFLAGRGESGSRLPLLDGGAAAGVGDSRAAAHNTILILIATVHSCAGLLVLQMWHEQASVLILKSDNKAAGLNEHNMKQLVLCSRRTGSSSQTVKQVWECEQTDPVGMELL